MHGPPASLEKGTVEPGLHGNCEYTGLWEDELTWLCPRKI